MLLTAKSFRFFEISAWPLPPQNFTILTQKIERGEQWKVRYEGKFSILAGILGYLEDSSFRIILKRIKCFQLPNLLAFLG